MTSKQIVKNWVARVEKHLWGDAPAPNSDKTICPICGGSGKHLIQTLIVNGKSLDNIEACPECKGTGHIV